MVLSNMNVIKKEKDKKYTTHFFEKTPKIPPYLVAMLMGDYLLSDSIELSNKIKIEIYH